MATVKVTITLEEIQLARIRELVNDGATENISAFVKHAVKVAINDIDGWGVLMAEALAQTGGALTPVERTWADSILRTRPARMRVKGRRAA